MRPAPALESIDPATSCLHALTVPAEWPRWRVCLECGVTVHRSRTTHYLRLIGRSR